MGGIASTGNSALAGPARPLLVRRAAVLGAGTMGSRIAAHLANAGIPVLLLDLPPKEGVGKSLASAAIEALAKSKPTAFFEPSVAALITPGNFDDDLHKLGQCDWVVEAVAENLAIKTALLARVMPHLAAHALLTTNTSGLPIKQIAAGLGSHRDRFFGAHFFNPPRYMRLLEVIPTAEIRCSPGRGICCVCRSHPGQAGGLRARHSQLYRQSHWGGGELLAAELMLEQGLTIEEIDALTGQAVGWPQPELFASRTW